MKKTKKTVKDKRQIVRKIIVMRRVAEQVYRVPYLRTYANQMACDVVDLAKANGLDYALITGKF